MSTFHRNLIVTSLLFSFCSLFSACKFYTSLLGYPHTPGNNEFSYYDSNFREHNKLNFAENNIQLSGYYFNRDSTSAAYRYLKFFDDGRVVCVSTVTPPDSATKSMLNRAPWFATGRFKFKGDTIYIETKNELEGNKSYFHKVVSHKNGIQTFIKKPRETLISLDYQYRPD